MLVHGHPRLDRPDRGGFRMGRMGHVDACGGVVRLVAGVAEWVSTAGVVDLLNKSKRAYNYNL